MYVQQLLYSAATICGCWIGCWSTYSAVFSEKWETGGQLILMFEQGLSGLNIPAYLPYIFCCKVLIWHWFYFCFNIIYLWYKCTDI